MREEDAAGNTTAVSAGIGYTRRRNPECQVAMGILPVRFSYAPKAVYNYMHGMGLDEDVRVWFEREVPKARAPSNFIRKALSEPESP